MNISSLEEVDLPVYKGSIQGLNTADLDYLIIASDLEGRVDNGKGYNSLGSILPDRLMKLFHFLYPIVDH